MLWVKLQLIVFGGFSHQIYEDGFVDKGCNYVYGGFVCEHWKEHLVQGIIKNQESGVIQGGGW